MACGNPRRGAAAFKTICAVCHGFDGKEINFKDEKKPEYVGTVCVKSSWEALRKIRFGHHPWQPGEIIRVFSSLWRRGPASVASE
jgi:mono/diheme cytochrome c family protein